jgi:hypothetical protein
MASAENLAVASAAAAEGSPTVQAAGAPTVHAAVAAAAAAAGNKRRKIVKIKHDDVVIIIIGARDKSDEPRDRDREDKQAAFGSSSMPSSSDGPRSEESLQDLIESEELMVALQGSLHPDPASPE